jgi:hypothetical protein
VLDILHCVTNISYICNLINLLTALKWPKHCTYAAHISPHWLSHLNVNIFNENFHHQSQHIIMLPFTHIYPPSCYFLPLTSNYSSLHHLLNIPKFVLTSATDQLSHMYITSSKINTVHFNPYEQFFCKYILCYQNKLTACYIQSLHQNLSQLYVSLYQYRCVHDTLHTCMMTEYHQAT